MEKFKLEREKCQENKIRTYRNQKDRLGKGSFMYCIKCGNEIPNEARFCQKCGAPVIGKNPIHGGTEVNSRRKGKKVMPVIIIVGLITIAVIGITVITKGTSGGLENTMQESSAPLLSQIENKYGIEIPEIQAAGGSAVGKVVLEDYLPYEGYQRFTSIVAPQTGEENTVEEITMYLADGKAAYSLYSNLANVTVEGILELDESGEYYYTVQENLLITGETDTDVYIGLPEKTWTKTKDEETVQIFIAPEYYTVTTPHGTYENCLLKYEEYSGGQTMFSAYAPNGVGKVIDVGWWNPTENAEESLYYYTYNPDDISATENSDIADMPDSSMIITDLLDDEGAEFWTNGNGTDSFMLTMRIEEDGTHLYMFNPSTYEMPYSGLIFDGLKQENSVMGDPGCSEGKLVFISDGELELTIRNDIYTFYKN